MFSLILPLCFPLLHKRSHALPSVMCGKGRVEESLFSPESFTERRFVSSIRCLLANVHGNLGLSSNDIGGLDGFIHHLVNWKNSTHQAPSMKQDSLVCNVHSQTVWAFPNLLVSFLCSNVLSTEVHLHCPGFADRPRQSLRSPNAGYGAQVYLRLAELCLLASIDYIAHHGQFTAAAQSKAIDSSDDGLANLYRQKIAYVRIAECSKY